MSSRMKASLTCDYHVINLDNCYFRRSGDKRMYILYLALLNCIGNQRQRWTLR
jgi:hypothetical protein